MPPSTPTKVQGPPVVCTWLMLSGSVKRTHSVVQGRLTVYCASGVAPKSVAVMMSPGWQDPTLAGGDWRRLLLLVEDLGDEGAAVVRVARKGRRMAVARLVKETMVSEADDEIITWYGAAFPLFGGSKAMRSV